MTEATGTEAPSRCLALPRVRAWGIAMREGTDDDEPPWAEPPKTRRRWAVVLGGLLLLGAWQRHALEDLARGVVGAELRHRPEHPPQLDGLDLAAVHGPLLTDWVIAAGRDDPEARAGAQAALRSAIAADANLTALFDELVSLTEARRLADPRHRKRALWITRAWNQYLDDNGQPYFLDAHVRVAARPSYVAMAYRVGADGRGTVDGEEHRVRLLERVDTLNLRELYTGYASSSVEGALVLADRTRQFAEDRLWPALADELAPTPSTTAVVRHWRALGPSLVAAAERGLSGTALAVLRDTAAARAEGVAVAEAVQARHDCGSEFILRPLPWNGFEPDALDRLERWVEIGPCPSLTAEELAGLRRASAALRAPEVATALPSALAELAAWRGRGVALHELRHVADDVDLDDDDDLPCAICPASASTVVRAELAAYLAELAWSEAPENAFFDACLVAEADQTAHAEALAILFDAAHWSCAAIPDELSTRARALEQDAFGRSEEIVVLDPLRGAAAAAD